MIIQYEKEVCAYLNLPNIPKKEWDGQSAFDKGVAIVKLAFDAKAYAVARFNPEKDKTPNVVKVFASEPFYGIEKILVVPDYMETNVDDADLDEESKRKAEELAREAAEIENDGTKVNLDLPENPYLFDNIHNDEEAIAFIQAYNQKNGIKGAVPKKHDTILNRLLVIYTEQRKAAGVDEQPVGDQGAAPEDSPEDAPENTEAHDTADDAPHDDAETQDAKEPENADAE